MAERLLVRDLMSVGVATCAPDTPIIEIARLLLEKKLEAVVVLNEEGHAVGIVSQKELVKAYTRDNHQQLTAEAIMHDGVPSVPPDIPLTAAAQIMQDQDIRVIYLMHHAGGIAYPAAVLSYQHLLRHLAARSDEELNDLGIKAARQAPLDEFLQKRDAARKRASFPHQE